MRALRLLSLRSGLGIGLLVDGSALFDLRLIHVAWAQAAGQGSLHLIGTGLTIGLELIQLLLHLLTEIGATQLSGSVPLHLLHLVVSELFLWLFWHGVL